MKEIITCISKNMYLVEKEVFDNNVSSENEAEIINIYSQVEYQEILGFGGALTESSAYNYSLLSKTDKEKFLKLYFDEKDGAAYNIGRLHINSCDFSLDRYTCVAENDEDLSTFDISRDKKYIIPFIKDIQEYSKQELFLFASPWTAPAYMKDNHSMVKGGSVCEKYKRLWAHYYAKFIKAYLSCGIKISAITVQNEPKASQSWESCFYSAADERTFIEKYLIVALDEEKLSDVKIIIWDHNKERVFERACEVFENKKIRRRVWAVGHHWYSGDHFEGLRLVYEVFDKPTFCTEFCGGMKSEFETLPERYGKEICENLNNFDIAICDWNLLLNKEGGPYHDRNYDNGAKNKNGCYAPLMMDENNKLVIMPIYYYIAHFSKFIKKNAKRVATTKYTEELNVSAFCNPDKTIVCIIVNRTDKELPAIIRYNGTATKITTFAHSIQTIIL